MPLPAACACSKPQLDLEIYYIPVAQHNDDLDTDRGVLLAH